MTAARVVTVPGDKSISHRALMLAALARGASRVRGILQSADVESTARVLRALGAQVPPVAPDMTIVGRGAAALRASRAPLDCGNSGTTARLVAGIAAALPFASRLAGDASLSRRPMRRVAAPLTAMGARVEFPDGRDGLPMTVHGGALHAVHWNTEVASAQVKSAILLAATAAGVAVVVREPAPTRDHTERMLAALGKQVRVSGTEVSLDAGGDLSPLDLLVPGDPSSAAFLLAYAVLAGDAPLEVPHICLNPTRTGFVRALARMGARIETLVETASAGEEQGTLRAARSALQAITLDGSDAPGLIDELPLLACVASRATGETVISGAGELRVKESDRIATVVANLRALGVDADERPDGMRVAGSARPLRGLVRTRGDHRVAMAFGVLAALPGSEIDIDDRSCAVVSYPGFWHDLAAIAAPSPRGAPERAP